METLVFVYGTLKRGFPNNHCLSGAEYVGNAVTVDKYPLVIATRYNLPYLLGAKNVGNCISGEVFKVNPSQLQVLDSLEGYPDHYNRIEIKVVMDSDVIDCHTYVLDRYKECLLELPMLNNYSQDDCMKYVRPCDRPDKNVDFRNEALDHTK